MHEKRLIGGSRRTLSDIVADFLREVRRRAEAATGRTFTRALSGRPVHFHTGALEKDARAEADLRACYHAAGFERVDLLAEPEAAAFAAPAMGAGRTGLIVDIGGGTSDFSVFRQEGARIRILASHGIRLGGTDFDRLVSMAFAMPLLGLGGALRREMGAGTLPVPRAPYVDLSTWAKIPFLYTAETRRSVARMGRLAVEPAGLGRFGAVLEMELGHELAFAVERGKIDANAGAGEIAMGMVEPGLAVPVTRDAMEAVLADARAALGTAAAETLSRAGIDRSEVDAVILVGGSSLMGFVQTEMEALCPAARLLRSEAFTAVVDGLARAAGGR